MTKMILVCNTKKKLCKQEGYLAEVGNNKYTFCCEQGFKDSLEDFKNSIK